MSYWDDLSIRAEHVRAATIDGLMSMPAVAGVWAVGSAARGAADVYSDVDLLAVVTDTDHEAAAHTWVSERRSQGQVLHTNVMCFGDSTTVNVVLAPWIRLDVSFVPTAGLRQRVKGTAVHLAGSQVDAPEVSWPGTRRTIPDEQAQQLVAEFYRVLALAPVALGRGDLLVAITGLGLLRDMTIRVLKATQDRPDTGGMMHLKHQLPPAAYATLLHALTPPPTPAAIRDAHTTIEALFWTHAQPRVQHGPGYADLDVMRAAALEHFHHGT